MLYIERLESGLARVHLTKPKDIPVIEIEKLPEGSGVLRFFSDGSLSFDASIEPKPTESPIGILQKENELLKSQVKAQSDRADFMEDCLAEMSAAVYNT